MNQPRETGRIWTPFALYSVLVLCLVVALGVADAQLRTLLLEPLKRDLAMTDTQFGQLGLAAALCAVLAAFPLGWLADKTDRRWVLAACALLWSAATLAAGMAQNFAQLLGAGIGLALGEAAMLPIIYAMVPERFTERQRPGVNAALYAVILLSGSLTLSLGGAAYKLLESQPELLPLGAPLAPWRVLYFAFGIPGLVAALMLLTLRRGAAPSIAKSQATSGFGNFLRSHGLSIVLIDIALATYSTAWALLGAWTPAVLSRSFGLSVGDAGVSFGAVSLVANLAGILGGWWSAIRWLPHWGPGAHLRLVKLGAMAAIVPIAALAFANSAATFMAGVGLAMAVLSLATSQAPAIMQDMAPAMYRSRTIALFPLIAMPVAGLGVAVGALSDRIGPPDGLRFAVVSVAVFAIVLGYALLVLAQGRYKALVIASKAIDAGAAGDTPFTQATAPAVR
jgi:MFS family permease